MQSTNSTTSEQLCRWCPGRRSATSSPMSIPHYAVGRLGAAAEQAGFDAVWSSEPLPALAG